MEAPPPQLSPAKVKEYFVSHCNSHYVVVDGALHCRFCGGIVESVVCRLSVHEEMFGNACAGSGEVLRLPLFFCRPCEGEPIDTSSCVHVSLIGGMTEELEALASPRLLLR